MKSQIFKYLGMLEKEASAIPESIAIAVCNDTVFSEGNSKLAPVASQLLQCLGSTAVIIASPLYPFPDFLLRRLQAGTDRITPRDSESRTFLHDIPFVRKTDDIRFPVEAVTDALKKRKVCIAEGFGMVSHGSLTLEQAYINWSSLLHAITIKYLEDLPDAASVADDEKKSICSFMDAQRSRKFDTDSFGISDVPPLSTADIISGMIKTGNATVSLGLVDSFFGNISCATDDRLFISKTSARLDQLDNQIVSVCFDNSSTAGITASSELPAHLAVYRETGHRIILHGHPRFPVVMGFYAKSSQYEGIEYVGNIPVVGGEGGAGGLADSLPRAFRLTGSKSVIVRGHGVFTISDTGFMSALKRLTDVELFCMARYFSMLQERFGLYQ